MGRGHATFDRVSRALCADFNQIPLFNGNVVMDLDDPTFAEYEARLLASPNVCAYVVTNADAAHRYHAMGVDKPFHVIPQDVALDLLNPDAITAVRSAHREPGDFVLGYVAAWLLSSGDRGGGDPLNNVDHLLDLWTVISAELPSARLWLIGQASETIQARCHELGNVVLFGRVAPNDVLPRVANLDVGSTHEPRTKVSRASRSPSTWAPACRRSRTTTPSRASSPRRVRVCSCRARKNSWTRSWPWRRPPHPTRCASGGSDCHLLPEERFGVTGR